MKKDELKLRSISWKRWSWFGGSALAIILGFLLAFQWSSDRANAFLAFGTVLLWAAGALLLWKGLSYAAEKVIVTGMKQPTTNVNSLNIYARLNDRGKVVPDRLAFEDVESPKGQPMRCFDDGRSYFVHIWDLTKKALVPFVLPDGQYFDPGEFANVLEMPAHKRLFQRKVSMMQKLGPWIMVVALAISLFILAVFIPKGG